MAVIDTVASAVECASTRDHGTTLDRWSMIVVNASSAAVLATGLLNMVAVPRLALSALGPERYGEYALLVGYGLIVMCLEAGLTPALTREAGVAYAAGETARAQALLDRCRRWVLLLGVPMCLLAGALAAAVYPAFIAIPAVFLAGLSNLITLEADWRSLPLRVSGRLVAVNAAKALANLTYLACMVAGMLAGLTILTIFVGQVVASIAYATQVAILRRREPATSPPAAAVRVPVEHLLAMALPEQLVRAQSALLPSVERTILFVGAGSTMVGAYDLALRASAVMSAIPVALAEPLVALLSTRSRAEHAVERTLVLTHTRQLTAVALCASAFGAFAFWKYVAGTQLGPVADQFFPWALLIVAANAWNACTATRVARLYALGAPGAVTLKAVADWVFAGIGIVAAIGTGKPMLYVAARFGGFGVTATLLFLTSRSVLARHEGQP